MINAREMSPEVLIYLQSIKKYFTSDTDAQEYFNIKGKEKEFFNNVSEISQKNFEENGEPELSPFQFEEIKNKMSKFFKKALVITGVFLSIGEIGHISLN